MKLDKSKYYMGGAALSLLLILATGCFYTFTAFSQKGETHYLYIDRDDTVDSVCAKLAPIASHHTMTGLKTMFRHGNYEKHLHTGRYAVKPGMSTFSVFRMLRSGTQEPLNLTIPEVRTLTRMAAILGDKLMLDSTEIATAFADPSRYREWGLNGADTCTLPGYFVPNTYQVYWNTELDQLMERLVKEHDRFWKGARETKAKVMGLTPNEVCTLASIVDEETSNSAEKPMIAGMYLNRLKAGMPLQADPTVKFALKDFAARRIYRKMLTYDSPYNTYKYEGLPPGPIKVASIGGIDAVLNYVEHNFLYMCAKEDFSGTHNFAQTYQEHLKNAAKYSQALNERGIK